MKILKASVVIRSGIGDDVCLTTDLPSPFKCDEGTKIPLFLHFSTAKNNGAEYVRKHFGIEPDIINTCNVGLPV